MKGKTMMRNLNISMKGALRPLAFALVLCLLVTMTPVGYGGAVFAAEDEQTITAQDEPMPIADDWDGSGTIGTGNTETIKGTVTVNDATINGTLVLEGTMLLTGTLTLDGGTIQGHGTIKRNGSKGYINVGNNSQISTISGITIDGNASQYTGDPALINMNAAGAILNLDGVMISNVAVSGSRASVIAMGAVEVYISGNTVIKGNKGDNGAIALSNSSAKLYLKDNVQIYNNKKNDGKTESNIVLNNENQLIVNGQLTDGNDGALISLPTFGVNPTITDIVQGDGTNVKDCAKYADRFVADEFDDYGVVQGSNDNTLRLEEKKEITVKVEPNVLNAEDVLEWYDALAERLGKKHIEKALKEEMIYIEVKDANQYFLKELKAYGRNILENENGGKYTFEMENSPANVDASFEEYITEVELTGIDAPIHGAEIPTNFSGAKVGNVTPSSAKSNVGIAPNTLAWHDSGSDSKLTNGTFDANDNKKYKLKGQLTADNGSLFAKEVNVRVGEKIATATIDGDEDENRKTLNFSLEFDPTKMPIEEAVKSEMLRVTVTSYSGIYDGDEHKITVNREDTLGGIPVVEYSLKKDSDFSSSEIIQKDATDEEVTVYVSISAIENYAGTYLTQSSIKIGRRQITPSVDVSGVVPKVYDGTKTVEGAKLTFDKASESGTTGLVTGESLTEGTDYTVSYELESENAGTKKVNAKDIKLLPDGDTAKNYKLAEDQAYTTASEDLVTPDTPKGSVNWSGVGIKVGVTTLKDIFDKINGDLRTLLDFKGEHSGQPIVGNLEFVEEDSENTINEPELSKTVVEWNKQYKWKFKPTGDDEQNYNTLVGSDTLASSEPIKTIIITGLAKGEIVGGKPTAGAIEHLSAFGSAGTEGEAPHEMTVKVIKWTVPNSANSTDTTEVTDTFWYNREHTVTIEITPQPGDKIADGVEITFDGNKFEKTTESATSVTLTCKFDKTPVGSLSDDNISASGITAVYSGKPYTLTAEAVNLQNPEAATIEYSVNGQSPFSENPPSFENVTETSVTVRLTHEDYVGTDGTDGAVTTTVAVKIAPAELGVKFVDETELEKMIQTRPYDETTDVKIESGYSFNDLFEFTVDGDSVNYVEVADAKIEFTDKDVNESEGNSIKVTGITFTADSTKNYALKTGIFDGDGINAKVGAKITKATPMPQDRDNLGAGTSSILWDLTPGNEADTTLDGLNFRLNPDMPFINEEVFKADRTKKFVTGTLTLTAIESNQGAKDEAIRKNRKYEWKFEPTGDDANNYKTLTDSAMFWKGVPIPAVTLSGIKVTAAGALLEKTDIGLKGEGATDNITVTAIKWTEGSGTGTLAGNYFKYNRTYFATITISAVMPDGSEVPEDNFARNLQVNLENSGGVDWEDIQVEWIDDFNVTIVIQFKPTAQGTIEAGHIEFSGEKLANSGGVWTGIYNAEADKYLTVSTKNLHDEYDTIGAGEKILYSTVTSSEATPSAGTFTLETPPKFKNAGDYYVHVKVTHDDYAGEYTTHAQVKVNKKDISISNITVKPKEYDDSTSVKGYEILLSGVLPADESNVEAVAESIRYSDASVGDGNKTVNATGIHLTSGSENYSLTEEIFEVQNATITKATPKGEPSHAPISSSVSLSAIGLVTEGAVFVNRNNTSLEVIGTLQLTTAGGTRYLTEEELDAILVVRGLPYAWKFEPNEEHETNYNSVTGSTILWLNPSAPSGGGGGGGGGGTVQSKPSDTDNMVTGTAVVVERVTSGEGSGQGDELSDTIHVYLVKNGRVVETETYTAKLAGEIVRDVLKRNPNANVVVGADGKPIAKAMIDGDNILIQAIGSKYLTPEFRRANFTDIDGHWAKQAIEFCAVRELMQGVGNNEFSPNEQVTRSMAVTLFYRLEQEPYSVGVSGFNDIDESWFTDAINWASSNSIVNGFGIYFAPYWSITREQLAVMLYNYSVICLGEERVTEIDLSMYGDVENIGEWAKEAVSFCTAKGLMQGESNTGFYPTRTATRAELAVIMERVVKMALEGAEESVSIGK